MCASHTRKVSSKFPQHAAFAILLQIVGIVALTATVTAGHNGWATVLFVGLVNLLIWNGAVLVLMTVHGSAWRQPARR